MPGAEPDSGFLRATKVRRRYCCRCRDPLGALQVQIPYSKRGAGRGVVPEAGPGPEEWYSCNGGRGVENKHQETSVLVLVGKIPQRSEGVLVQG